MLAAQKPTYYTYYDNVRMQNIRVQESGVSKRLLM